MNKKNWLDATYIWVFYLSLSVRNYCHWSKESVLLYEFTWIACLCASVVIAKMLFFSSLQLRQLLCMCFFAVHAFSLSFYSQVCKNYLFWLCMCSDLSRLLQKITQLCTNIRNLITHWPNRPMREKRKKGKDNKIPDCMTNSRLFATRWQRNAWPLAIYEHVIGSSMLIWSYFHLIQ